VSEGEEGRTQIVSVMTIPSVATIHCTTIPQARRRYGPIPIPHDATRRDVITLLNA